jgi:hypothetical protein
MNRSINHDQSMNKSQFHHQTLASASRLHELAHLHLVQGEAEPGQRPPRPWANARRRDHLLPNGDRVAHKAQRLSLLHRDGVGQPALDLQINGMEWKTSLMVQFEGQKSRNWGPHLRLRLGGECRREPQGGVGAHRAKAGVQVVEAWVRQLAEDQLEVAAQLPDVVIGLRRESNGINAKKDVHRMPKNVHGMPKKDAQKPGE